jgi:hypothetical protein
VQRGIALPLHIGVTLLEDLLIRLLAEKVIPSPVGEKREEKPAIFNPKNGFSRYREVPQDTPTGGGDASSPIASKWTCFPQLRGFIHSFSRVIHS